MGRPRRDGLPNALAPHQRGRLPKAVAPAPARGSRKHESAARHESASWVQKERTSALDTNFSVLKADFKGQRADWNVGMLSHGIALKRSAMRAKHHIAVRHIHRHINTLAGGTALARLATRAKTRVVQGGVRERGV